MITLKESIGDLRLCKFFIFNMKKIPSLPDNYIDELHMYYIEHEYTFNFPTWEFNEEYLDHRDIADELPKEIGGRYPYQAAYGVTDVTEEGKLYIWWCGRAVDNSTPEQRAWVEKRMQKYMNQKVQVSA